VALAPGERQEGGGDAVVPVAHEFPGPGDADEQRADQDVAEHVDRYGLIRVGGHDDPRDGFDPEHGQQQHDQPDLAAHPGPRDRVGQDGPQPAEGEQQADDTEHGGRIPDLVVRHQAEEGDRQGVGEGQQRGRRPDLPDNVRTLAGGPPGRHESATNSRPVSAPAAPAIATNRSRYVPVTTGRQPTG
jgi:hypothetical protein